MLRDARVRACHLLLGLLPLACSHPSRERPGPAPEAAVSLSSVAPIPPPTVDVAIDPMLAGDDCVFGHDGTVIDFGDPDLHSRFGARLTPAPIEIIEREGATWARVRAKSLAVDFYVSTPASSNGSLDGGGGSPILEARVRGGSAKTVAFYLNGKPAGAAALVKGEARVISFRSPAADTVPGANELAMRFGGAPRATTDPFAEIDWVHLGRGEPDPKYAAPVRGEISVSANLHGAALRALSIRPGGWARCPGFIPAGAEFTATIGLSGEGSADADVRLVRDRAAPTVLGTFHLAGPDANGRPVAIPIGDLGDTKGTLAAIELHTLRASPGARVLFAEARVSAHRSTPPERHAPATSAVLVVLDDLATRSLELYGGSRSTPVLSELAKRGIVFEAHRATTVLETGAFASMITGLLPRAAAVDDPDARLPASITTIADAARQAGVSAALFTAVPTTGAAFGMNRGWSTFESLSPSEPGSAVSLVDHAAAWIQAHKDERFLLVVHARGGHPPWDVTSEELRSLEPQNYTGGLEPRHAAELLSRASTSPGSLRFGDADRARAWAMHEVAIRAHDAALGRLEAALDATGHRRDTAIMVTGDVGVDAAMRVPFAQPSALTEDTLWVPLVLALPEGEAAGVRVATPTSGQDVAGTLLSILGLAPPIGFGGIDLVDLAEGRIPPFPRPLSATVTDRFSVRWGDLIDSGQRERETRLCDLSLEPACVSDVRSVYPLASSLLHAAAFDALVGGRARPAREPVTIDPETAAALHIWGR